MTIGGGEGDTERRQTGSKHGCAATACVGLCSATVNPRELPIQGSRTTLHTPAHLGSSHYAFVENHGFPPFTSLQSENRKVFLHGYVGREKIQGPCN